MLEAIFGPCLVVALTVGFFGGIATYAWLYKDFKVREEAVAARKANAFEQKRRVDVIKQEQVVKKMKAMYGNDLSEHHQEVMDEEIEKILGKGLGGKQS